MTRYRKYLHALVLLALMVIGFSRTEVGAQTIQRSFARVGRMLVGDGSAAAPSMSFASQPNVGWYHAAPNTIDYGVGGIDYAQFNGNNLNLLRDNSVLNFGTAADTALSRTAAGKVSLTGTTPMLQFGGTTSSFPALKQTSSALLARLADDSAYADFIAGTVSASTAQITQASGTGITPTVGGALQRVVYKTTITSPAFICAALTCDITIATLPAGTVLVGVYNQITVPFACAAVCTSTTLSYTLGSSAGAADIFASTDADVGTNIFGNLDAHLGTAMVRAAAVQGGHLFSIASTTPVSMRFSSTTGNIGTGAATNLSAGTTIWWLVTEKLP
jgi:hypothetical protein